MILNEIQQAKEHLEVITSAVGHIKNHALL